MADPFTDTLDALWTQLESAAEFTALVRAANRIKLSDDTDPTKRQTQDADAPEVTISPATGSATLQATSSSNGVALAFNIDIITYDMRLKRGLFPVLWVVFKVMSAYDADSYTITSGEIIRVSVTGVSITEDDPKNRGTSGWCATVTVEVEMNFNRADMEPA